MTGRGQGLGAGGPVLVVGLAVTGTAVARHFLGLGRPVLAIDDHADEAMRGRAARLGVELVQPSGPAELKELVDGIELVVVSPGVPARHAIFSLDAPVVSELEVAGRLAAEKKVPMIAVTGTNGKTTVTTLIAEILMRSGIRAPSAGNIGTPLLEVLDRDPEMVVVEASSFQLALTEQFRPWVATWINLAEDHLDWHPSLAHYVSAKARVWANQGAGDFAVANADDPVVLARARAATARTLVTYGLGPVKGGRQGYHQGNGSLLTPGGEQIISIAQLWRSHPHDRSNALAASAASLAAGASLEACREVLAGFGGLAHRLELVGEAAGVRWFDDSKATTPSSVLAALAGFDSVVLIAGGRNKGLDLGVLAGGGDHLRAIIAIGEAAAEIEAAFGGTSKPVLRAASMEAAVDAAGELARPGDVVLLSPGCASFDWYGSYAERGRHFAELVRRRRDAALGEALGAVGRVPS